MKILIFGLPGSGKSTLAEPFANLINGHWVNADQVRQHYDDWDFSLEGRLRQAQRMRYICDGIVRAGGTAIADFVCPTENARREFDADYTVWMDTIAEGRFEDIRECIGCNICYAHDSLGVPIRCTQNPTMGEEWRFGWHPEKIKKKKSPKRFLVVGAGPSGLEAARVLGEQGNKVILAEATRNLGGRVIKESNLLGLAEWRRVSDWRITQINKLPNIEIYRESELVANDVTELNVDFVMIATGAKWAEDAVGRHSDTGFETTDKNMIIGAERILNGEKIDAECIVIYDDDHYYIGSVMALELAKRGHKVVLVTPAGRACSWGKYTDEQVPSNLALYDANVKVVTNKTIINVEQGTAEAKCIYSSEVTAIKCDAIIPLTRRIPSVDLYNSLATSIDNECKPSIIKIGDADAPSHIAAAIYSGYRSAIEFRKKFSSSEFYGRRENELI